MKFNMDRYVFAYVWNIDDSEAIKPYEWTGFTLAPTDTFFIQSDSYYKMAIEILALYVNFIIHDNDLKIGYYKTGLISSKRYYEYCCINGYGELFEPYFDLIEEMDFKHLDSIEKLEEVKIQLSKLTHCDECFDMEIFSGEKQEAFIEKNLKNCDLTDFETIDISDILYTE